MIGSPCSGLNRGGDLERSVAEYFGGMEMSHDTRNIIASAKMEGVELSEQTIIDLQAIEAGTKTAEQSIAEYLEARNLTSGR